MGPVVVVRDVGVGLVFVGLVACGGGKGARSLPPPEYEPVSLPAYEAPRRADPLDALEPSASEVPTEVPAAPVSPAAVPSPQPSPSPVPAPSPDPSPPEPAPDAPVGASVPEPSAPARGH